MSDRGLPWIVLAAAILPTSLNAQSTEAPAPTKEALSRLLEASDGYVRVVTGALNWKAPATPECAGSRMRIESLVAPLMGPDPSLPTDTPQALLQAYQRAEENTMARHSLFSREVYEAAKMGCLSFPPPLAVPNDPKH